MDKYHLIELSSTQNTHTHTHTHTQHTHTHTHTLHTHTPWISYCAVVSVELCSDKEMCTIHMYSVHVHLHVWILSCTLVFMELSRNQKIYIHVHEQYTCLLTNTCIIHVYVPHSIEYTCSLYTSCTCTLHMYLDEIICHFYNLLFAAFHLFYHFYKPIFL